MPRTGPLLLTAAVTLPAADCSWYFFGSGTCLGPPVSGTQDAYYNECQKHPLTLAGCQSECVGTPQCLSVTYAAASEDCRLNIPRGASLPSGCDYAGSNPQGAANPVTSVEADPGWECYAYTSTVSPTFPPPPPPPPPPSPPPPHPPPAEPPPPETSPPVAATRAPTKGWVPWPTRFPTAFPTAAPSAPPLPDAGASGAAVGGTVAVAAVSGTTLSAAGALGAARFAMLLGSGCGQVERIGELSVILHPTRMRLGNSSHSEYAGCVVGNALVVSGMCAVHFAAVAFWARFRGAPKVQASGFLMFPGVTIFVFVFLFQGSSLSTSYLVFTADDDPVWMPVLGVVSLIGMGCTAVLMWRWLGGVGRDAVWKDDCPLPGRPLRLLIGRGEWVSVHGSDFVRRFGAAFSRFRLGCSRFLLTDMLFSLALAALSAAPAHSCAACARQRSAMSCTCFLYGILIAFRRPHNRPVANFADSMVNLLLGAGLAALAVTYSNCDAGGSAAGTHVIEVALILAVLRSLTDLLAVGWCVLTNRRRKLEEGEAGGEGEEELQESPKLTLARPRSDSTEIGDYLLSSSLSAPAASFAPTPTPPRITGRQITVRVRSPRDVAAPPARSHSASDIGRSRGNNPLLITAAEPRSPLLQV